ncbi:MAG: universal stress protein [Pirellulales bacterium]|nr:universal stress protein [Pirellulales bacterium]
MPRSLLLAVDSEEPDHAAAQLALDWAREHDALLAMIGVVDLAQVSPPEPVPLGGGFAKQVLDQVRSAAATAALEGVLQQLADRCAAARVRHLILERHGDTAEELATQAQRFDLIVMPRRASHRFEPARCGLAGALWELLHFPPRPVIAVPAPVPPGQGVMIAFDGSLQAARALQAYQQSGLLAGQPLHILTLDDDPARGALVAERARDFLHQHDLSVQVHVESAEGSPGTRLVSRAVEWNVGLIVMGAYGQSRWREWFLGSATRTVLATSPLPLFLVH